MNLEKDTLDKLCSSVRKAIENLQEEEREVLNANSLKGFQSLVLSQGMDAYIGFQKVQIALRPNEKRKYDILEDFLGKIRKEFNVSDKKTFATFIGYAARISSYELEEIKKAPENSPKGVNNSANDRQTKTHANAKANDSVFAQKLTQSLEKGKKK